MITSVPARRYFKIADETKQDNMTGEHGSLEISLSTEAHVLIFTTVAEFGKMQITKDQWEEIKEFVDEEFADV